MVSMSKVEGFPIPIVGGEKCQCFSDFKVYIWFFCGAAHLGPQATITLPLYTLKYWHNYLLFFLNTYMHPAPPHFWQVYPLNTWWTSILLLSENLCRQSFENISISLLRTLAKISLYFLLLVNTFSPCKVGRINPLNLYISMYTLHTASFSKELKRITSFCSWR